MWSNSRRLVTFDVCSMRKVLKYFTLLLAVGGLAVCQVLAATPGSQETSTAGKSPKVTDLFPDVVVAKGKGVEVKRSQLDDAMISIKSTLAARGQELPPDEMNRLEQQILDRLIQIQILLQKATDS